MMRERVKFIFCDMRNRSSVFLVCWFAFMLFIVWDSDFIEINLLKLLGNSGSRGHCRGNSIENLI